MNKIKPIVIGVIIIFLLALILVFISKQLKKDEPLPEREKSAEEAQLDWLKQEALMRWEINCAEENGIWVPEHEMCYQDNIASEMKTSCELMNGFWLEDSLIYECRINNEIFKKGEWALIDWEKYENSKQSCLANKGEWLGGAQEACKINGNIFYSNQWLLLAEMEKSCVKEFKGKWLGGEKMECLLDGIIYPGNWVQIINMKDSCLNYGGEWLGGDDSSCLVDEAIYSNKSWELIEDAKFSCNQYGGEFIGGDIFACSINDEIFYNKQWERASVAPNMSAMCESDGGIWLDEYRECEGLSVDWCIKAESTFSEIRGLSFNECASACRHNPEADMCTMQCVPVCTLNLR